MIFTVISNNIYYFMRYSFREFHLFQILEQLANIGQRIPLDRYLSTYFRKNKGVGAKDRKEICHTLYDMIRWRGLLDYLARISHNPNEKSAHSVRQSDSKSLLEAKAQNDPSSFCEKNSLSKQPLTWQSRYDVYTKTNWRKKCHDLTIPPHIRVSFPKAYFNFLETSIGEEKALMFCLNSNERAPTTIRVNPLKTTRQVLLKKWSPLYDISPTPISPWGIIFRKNINFFALPEFKEGLFEVQDEGSQLLANLMDVKPKDHVLDYCSGSGGKTLAFAHKMKKKGQIYLHDVRLGILKEAKKRLKRAGIENAKLLTYEDPQKKQLEGKMDWVLVDVPCSGSGTLRRNPDMKWKFNIDLLNRVIEEQQEIFNKALSFLKPEGKIVYATCSILPQENEEQIALFQKKFSLKLENSYKTFPHSRSCDGFFAAVMSR